MPNTEQQAKEAADKFRAQHGLGIHPLGDLVSLIEQTTNHEVAVLDAPRDEHGLTMYDPARRRAFIGVARTPNPMRQRSTLAHELGHLIFNDDPDEISARSTEEVRADAFARHLLIPIEGARHQTGEGIHERESTLSEIVQRFLVSPQIASIAMREAGIISSTVYESWKKFRTPYLATRFGWSDHYAALQEDSQRLRAPQRLIARAIAGYSQGVVSIEALATLRGVSVDTAFADLASIGVTPPDMDTSAFEVTELPDIDIDLSDLEDGSSQA